MASGPTAASRRRGYARMATQDGASALLVFSPTPFTLGQSPQMALAHFKRIADATDLPLIVFQYPLASGIGKSLAVLNDPFTYQLLFLWF
jgi:dihydrodipicolinate synthase/N-acetylneuraminate lyase